MPTPAPYNNAKCGLINIKNESDDECFKWCVKYHQTKQEKHDDRVSVLKKVVDKYSYDDMNFPASYEDIETFEENNKVSVFVYCIGDDNSIVREKRGNRNYCTNDCIYLLRIGDETKSHYIYIKHLGRLLNINTHVEDKDKRYCPWCENKFHIDKYDSHVKACHAMSCEGEEILKLPPKGSYMKFKNHKNKLMRPFIVYADCESTLQNYNDLSKTDNFERLQKHVVNSCCYYFVCEFDKSRN